MMWHKTLKMYRLFYSGEVKPIEIKKVDIIGLFNTLDIVAVYILKMKKLYIWVGSHASRTLKNYISQMREIFIRDFYDVRILRYITIEAHSEPFNFFQDTEIDKKTFEEHIQGHEKKLLPMLKEVERLKDQQDTLFESEEFDEALIIARDVIALAKEIEDPFLERDQRDFFRGIESKIRVKRLLEVIEDESKVLEEKIEHLSIDKNYYELHIYAIDFKEKYLREIKLANMEHILELLRKEDALWRLFRGREKEITNLSTLDAEIKDALENNDLKTASDILDKSKSIVELINIPNITKEWNKIGEDYKERNNRFLDEMSKFEASLAENEKNNNIEGVINDCQKLIEIAEKYNEPDLIKKYTLLLEENKYKLEEIEREKQENALKEGDIKKLLKLEAEIRNAFKNNNLTKASDILTKAIPIVQAIDTPEITQKWADIEEEYDRLKEIERTRQEEKEKGIDPEALKKKIEELDKQAKEALQKGLLLKSHDLFGQIIDLFSDINFE